MRAPTPRTPSRTCWRASRRARRCPATSAAPWPTRRRPYDAGALDLAAAGTSSAPPPVAEAESGPAEDHEHRRALRAFTQALAALPERPRAVLVLDAAGWSRTQIARHLEVSERVVKRVLADHRSAAVATATAAVDGADCARLAADARDVRRGRRPSPVRRARGAAPRGLRRLPAGARPRPCPPRPVPAADRVRHRCRADAGRAAGGLQAGRRDRCRGHGRGRRGADLAAGTRPSARGARRSWSRHCRRGPWCRCSGSYPRVRTVRVTSKPQRQDDAKPKPKVRARAAPAVAPKPVAAVPEAQQPDQCDLGTLGVCGFDQ